MSGLTVGDLRRVIDRLPDDTPVRVELPRTGIIIGDTMVPEDIQPPKLMEIGMTDKRGKALFLYAAEPLDP